MSRAITIVLAEDNLITREGIRALLALEDDLDVVGVASDYDELLAAAERHAPQAIVTDIRMPPGFHREGIDAAKEIRRRLPGTGVVILSQFDDPEYAVSLLGEGAAGFAYLLKDRVADGDQLARAIREVTSGGSLIDPRIVEGLVNPLRDETLTPADEDLLRQVAEGRPIKAIAAAQGTAPEAVSSAVESLFRKLAEGAGRGDERALQRLRMLHQAIVDREEQGERLSRLLPAGLAAQLPDARIGETQVIEVTVLMSDVRDYTTIAERADPSVLAGQLNEHRAAMSSAIADAGGTVMQFVGDAVMGVFGAPLPQEDHADGAVRAAAAMHGRQADLSRRWEQEGLPPFRLGIGISTGTVAAALLGSEERVEYTVVGDSVNLAQRLQGLASGGQTVLGEATLAALRERPDIEALEPTRVKGRDAIVRAYRIGGSPSAATGRGPAGAVRVLVVDDQRPFRDAAAHVVAATPGFEVAGLAESGEEAVTLAAELRPDLVLMDINLPGIDGLEATRQILAAAPGRIVVMALSADTGQATRALASGAAAFISKADFDPERLAEAWAAART